MGKNLSQKMIHRAFTELDALLEQKLTLVVGGGGALVMAYKFPLATEDVDAFSKEQNLVGLDASIQLVASKLEIASDWLNPYFSTFTGVLPVSYAQRLRPIFSGKHLSAFALGPEDLLLMKCFAGRDKDIPHARALLQVPGIELGLVEDQLTELIARSYPKAKKAQEFFDDLTKDL